VELTETIKTTPLQAEKSVRTVELRGITSGYAGKVIPVAYDMLLREDRVARGQMRVRVDMLETVRKLMNGINVTAHVYFVPFLAFDRFAGLDMMNASYQGVELRPGDGVVPFFETQTYNPSDELTKALGIHAATGATINTVAMEAYNVMWNHRAAARSSKLTQRLKSDTTLAQAFWKNPNVRGIVPDFDQAMIDGEVELNMTGLLPVYGIGVRPSTATWGNGAGIDVNETGGVTTQYGSDEGAHEGSVRVRQNPNNPGHPHIVADMQAAVANLSLSNIEMAKKTAAFARIRKKMKGLDDDAIIDLLMEGIRVPDAQLSQPILLDRKSTLIGYNERFATDAANLDVSRTSGGTFLDLRWRTPPMNTGGVVLVTVEIVPEQLNERMQDPASHVTDVSELPNFTRDYLDPEKVDIVKCSAIDVEHSTPDTTFGYEPLNAKWMRSKTFIGGKFFKRLNDTWSENRQRFWAVDTVDQQLTEDFYLVPADLPHTVFDDALNDPFDIVIGGRQQIVGNTVFGKGLTENTDDYATITADVDATRIDQSA
jgi:hypothetical protein